MIAEAEEILSDSIFKISKIVIATFLKMYYWSLKLVNVLWNLVFKLNLNFKIQICIFEINLKQLFS